MQFLTVKRGLRCRQSCVVEIQVLASMNTVPDGLLLQTSDHRVLDSARVTWTTDSSFWEAAQSQVKWILTNPIRHLQVYVLYELLFNYWNTGIERRVMCPFDPQRCARCTAQWGDSLACRSAPSFQTCKYLLFEWLPCRAEASYQIANAFNLRVEYL